jgi:predicted N-acetyltransferase YhbS
MNYYNTGNLIIRSMVVSDSVALADALQNQGWHKTVRQFEWYFSQQEAGQYLVFVATNENLVAGYVLLRPHALAGPYANQSIPEIFDFNVLVKYQRMGIGSKMMDIAESFARDKANSVCLGVGLHSGYGTAQRMYIKRGYIPDGSGVWYKDVQSEPYTPCQNDDDLVLYLKKDF